MVNCAAMIERAQMTNRAAPEILVVDDDVAVRKSYRLLFEGEGYAVRTARNGEEGLRLVAERRPDLVLLDVMMPKTNGIAVCQEIRRTDPRLPILFFTAMPSDVSLVRGLGCGADDYIDKTRPPEEFLARVNAALRRVRRISEGEAELRVLRLGGAEVDLERLTVVAEDEREEGLTKSEVQFLRLLSDKPGRVFSKDEIFAALRGEGYVGDDSALRSLVLRLRRKLGRGGNLIVSERGWGYRLMQ